MAPRISKHRPSSPRYNPYTTAAIVLLILSSLPAIGAFHHIKLILIQSSNPIETKVRQNNNLLVNAKNHDEDIRHRITAQGGSDLSETSFTLSPGLGNNFSNSVNRQESVWVGTNHSSDSDETEVANNGPGIACGTGDGNGMLNCQATVRSKTKTTFALLIAVLTLMIVAG